MVPANVFPEILPTLVGPYTFFLVQGSFCKYTLSQPGRSDIHQKTSTKGLILNEPCGQLGQVIVRYTVNMVVKQWGETGDSRAAIDDALQCLCVLIFSFTTSGILMSATHSQLPS